MCFQHAPCCVSRSSSFKMVRQCWCFLFIVCFSLILRAVTSFCFNWTERLFLKDFWTPEVFLNVSKPLFRGGLEFPEQPFETLRFVVSQQFHERGQGKAVIPLGGQMFCVCAKVGRQRGFRSWRVCCSCRWTVWGSSTDPICFLSSPFPSLLQCLYWLWSLPFKLNEIESKAFFVAFWKVDILLSVCVSQY